MEILATIIRVIVLLFIVFLFYLWLFSLENKKAKAILDKGTEPVSKVAHFLATNEQAQVISLFSLRLGTAIFESMWFIVAEVIFEPLLLGFTVFLVFNRLEPLVNHWLSDPTFNILHGLVDDMNHQQELYGIFFGIVLIWAFIKLVRLTEEHEINHSIKSDLHTIAEMLKKIAGEEAPPEKK